MGAAIADTIRIVAEISFQRLFAHGNIDCTQPRSSRFQKVPARMPIQPTMMPNTSGRPKAEVRGMLSNARRGEPISMEIVRPKAEKASSPGRSHGITSPVGGGADGGPEPEGGGPGGNEGSGA